MAEAIVKVSWRKDSRGFVSTAGAEGGIAGTCFTLDSGMTLTAADRMAGLFKPNAGFDACRVFVVERSGAVTALREQSLQSYPAHDACVIEGFQSVTRYIVSQKSGAIASCNLKGYRANAAPFTCQLNPTGTDIDVLSPHIESAAQDYSGLVPRSVVFDVKAADMRIVQKPGFVVDVRASIGLAGGPMLDTADGSVVGICVLGLPADAPEKTQIGIIDIRPFLYR
jgi:hypothetical protein